MTPVGNNEDGGGTYNKLFDAHPPFRIDGNFGCTSGITEMLMQSADEAIPLLPALPDVWQTGSITGLRARGGFTIVTMEWKDAKLVKVDIKSAMGGNLRLRVPNELKRVNGSTLKKGNGENKNPYYQTEKTPAPVISSKATIPALKLKETFVYDIPAKQGQVLILNPS